MLLAKKLIRHSGKDYKVGEEVTAKLSAEDKRRLFELGAIEEVGKATLSFDDITDETVLTVEMLKKFTEAELKELCLRKGIEAPEGSAKTALINLLKD